MISLLLRNRARYSYEEAQVDRQFEASDRLLAVDGSLDRWLDPGYEMRVEEVMMLTDMLNQLSCNLHRPFVAIVDWATKGFTKSIKEAVGRRRWSSLTNPVSVRAFIGIALHF